MDPFSYDAFELPKVTLMRWVSSFILAMWAIAARGFKTGSKKTDGKGSLITNFAGGSPLHFPVLYFSLVMITCTLFSVDFLSSLKGTYKRQEGLLTLLNYVFLFFVTARFMRDEKKIKTCLLLCVAAGTLTSFYAVLQHFGMDIFSNKGMERSFSTLNHPNFLAAYLVLVMPFAFVLMVETYEKNIGASHDSAGALAPAVIFAGCYEVMYLALLFTYCRGAWVGHIVSLLIILLFYGRISLWRCKAPLIAIFVSLFILTWFANHPKVHRGPFSLATRAASIVDTKNTTVVTRFIMWESALNVFKAHPLLGAGLDGFKAVFPQYKPESYVKFEGLHITADKVHNETLHMAATLGLAGLLGYLWLLASAGMMFLAAVVFRRQPFPMRYGCIALFASFAGYIAQNQFSFSVIATGMLSFMVLGLFASCMPWRKEIAEPVTPELQTYEKGKGRKKKEKKSRREEMALQPFSAVIGALVVILICAVSYKPYAADHYFLKGELYGQAGYTNEQIMYFERAILLNPYEEQYYIKLGEAYEAKAKTDPQAIRDAAEAYEKAGKLAPLNPYNFSKMGKAYVTLAKTTDKKNEWYDRALEVLERARELDPHNPVFFNNLGAVYNDTKQPEKSIPLLEYALSLSPDYVLALNNLGNALVQKKRYDEAVTYFSRGHARDKKNVTSLAGLGYCAYQQNNPCAAKKWFEKVLEVDPENKIALRFFDIVKTATCP